MKLKRTGHTGHCIFSLIKPDYPVQNRTPGNPSLESLLTHCHGLPVPTIRINVLFK